MSKRAPWHSIKQSVHHNDTDCNTGNNIERENLRQGRSIATDDVVWMARIIWASQ